MLNVNYLFKFITTKVVGNLKVIHFSAMFLLLFSMNPSLFAEGEMTRVPDPVFDLSGAEEIPSWGSGDYWNYSVETSYDLGLISIPLSGWINMSLDSILAVSLGPYDPSYLVSIQGNVSGSFITERLYVEIDGYALQRIQDLSEYVFIANTSVNGTVEDLNGFYPFGYEYDPPLEEYDFPLIPGDEWNVSTRAGIPFSEDTPSLWINRTYGCGQPVNLEVEAGEFMTHPVSLNGEESLWFNSTVGNPVKRLFSISLDSMEISIPMELSDYRHENRGDLVLDVETEQHVTAGEEFTVSAEVTGPSSLLSALVFFPGGELVKSELISGGSGDFKVDLTAPIRRDHTHSDFDHGSFGVLMVVYQGLALVGVNVCTVTTRSCDLLVNDSMVSANWSGEGTVDDRFDFRVRIANPSNFSAEGFHVNLTLKGNNNLYNETGPFSLEAKTNMTIDWSTHVDEPGQYRLNVTVDFRDEVTEYDEDNNRAALSFRVRDRPPLIWNTTPGERNITLREGEEVTFRASVSRGNFTLPDVSWYMDSVFRGTSPELTFRTDHTGKNSSRETPYNLTCRLPPNSTYPGENGSVTWMITVLEVNRPPEVIRVRPTEGNISIAEGGNISFRVNAVDRDGDLLNFRLIREGNEIINGSAVGSLDFDYIFFSEFTGYNSSVSSPVNITLSIYDSRGEPELLRIIWSVEIVDVDRPPEVDFHPEEGEIRMDPDENLTFGFDYSDPDGDPSTSIWYLDGVRVSNSSFFVLDPRGVGLDGGEVLNLTLSLRIAEHLENRSWTVMINETSKGGEEFREIENLSIISPVDGGVYEEGTTILLEARSDDPRVIEYIWYLDGRTYTGSRWEIAPPQPGNYTLILNCTVVEGDPGWSEIEVDFSVQKEEYGERDGPDEDGENSVTLLLVIGVIAALVILVAAVILAISRRNADTLEE